MDDDVLGTILGDGSELEGSEGSERSEGSEGSEIEGEGEGEGEEGSEIEGDGSEGSEIEGEDEEGSEIEGEDEEGSEIEGEDEEGSEIEGDDEEGSEIEIEIEGEEGSEIEGDDEEGEGEEAGEEEDDVVMLSSDDDDDEQQQQQQQQQQPQQPQQHRVPIRAAAGVAALRDNAREERSTAQRGRFFAALAMVRSAAQPVTGGGGGGGAGPVPRHAAACAPLGDGSALLLGGRGAAAPVPSPFDEVVRADAEGLTALAASGVEGPSLSQGAAAALAGGRVLFHGGVTASGGASALAFELDPARRRWTPLELAGDAVGPRTGHCAVPVDGGARVLLLMGSDGARSVADVHEARVAGRQLRCSRLADAGPPAREAFAAALCDGAVVLFGGAVQEAPDAPVTLLGDTHVLDAASGRWRASAAGGSGAPPQARCGHSLTCVPGFRRPSVVLHGGQTRSAATGQWAVLGDVHVLDVTTWAWSSVAASAPRAFHAAWPGAAKGRLCVAFGRTDLETEEDESGVEWVSVL